MVAEQTAEHAKKLSIKEIQGSRLTRQDPFLIKLHNKPFSQCSNPFSRCKAWGATVFRNSSWRLARLRMPRKSVRLWQKTLRTLETGIAPSELGPEAHGLPCEVVGSDEEFSNGVCIPGFSKMDTEGQEAIKRSLSNAIKEKRRLAKKCTQEGEGL